jgi:hypothetical protein
MGGKGSGNRRGRPPKVPGGTGVQHREVLGARLKVAINAIVEQNASVKEAAAAANMDESSVYKSLKRGPVRRFLFEQLEPLRVLGRVTALHSLLYEAREGKNAAAKVAASRALLETDDHPRLDRQIPGAPGLVVIIGSPGEQREPPRPPREAVTITPRAITAPVSEREPAPIANRADWWRQ